MNKTAFYITTAISYVNGSPHLGHAYEAIATDMIARFKRLDGYDVRFLTGTDEHGQKVEKTAMAHNMPPRQWVDKISQEFVEMTKILNISNDDFIRTSEERHHHVTHLLWQKLYDRGDIYLGAYKGWYSVKDEAFFAEDELVKNDKGELIAPSGAIVEWVEEPSYFFKLSAYGDRLLAYYNDNPDFIRPETRRNEIIKFVSSGLHDLSISRTSFKWGIDVPNDSDHIMYVWLDALTNYVTALDYPDGELYKSHWPADIHVIGKDILRFHTIYWPAFLMSADLPLPKQVFGHGFLNVNGMKMSKTDGNVLSPKALVDEFGLEPLRYFLMREVPFGKDGSFTRESIIHRINGDLANDLGNLGMRVLSMIYKNCDGKLPPLLALDEDDEAILKMAHDVLDEMREALEDRRLHHVLEAIWRLIGEANRYIDQKAPWILKKQDKERMGHVLAILAEVLRHIGIYIQAIMPHAGNRLLDQLAVKDNERNFAAIATSPLQAGCDLPKPEGLFPRFVEGETDG